MQEYGTIEAIYDDIENTPEKELKVFYKESFGISHSPIASLTKQPTDDEPIVGKKATFLSKDLATIRTAIPDYQELVLEEVALHMNKEVMKEQFVALEFKSLIDKV